MTKRAARGRKRKRKAISEAQIAAGRTFADVNNPLRWYVVLPVDFVWSLVWWEGGKPKVLPIAEVQGGRVEVTAFGFPVSQLLARWGITSAELDRFLEDHFYRHDRDVQTVRATRRPLTGRTLEHVRERYRGPAVGG